MANNFLKIVFAFKQLLDWELYNTYKGNTIFCKMCISKNNCLVARVFNIDDCLFVVMSTYCRTSAVTISMNFVNSKIKEKLITHHDHCQCYHCNSFPMQWNNHFPPILQCKHIYIHHLPVYIVHVESIHFHTQL